MFIRDGFGFTTDRDGDVWLRDGGHSAACLRFNERESAKMRAFWNSLTPESKAERLSGVGGHVWHSLTQERDNTCYSHGRLGCRYYSVLHGWHFRFVVNSCHHHILRECALRRLQYIFRTPFIELSDIHKVREKYNPKEFWRFRDWRRKGFGAIKFDVDGALSSQKAFSTAGLRYSFVSVRHLILTFNEIGLQRTPRQKCGWCERRLSRKSGDDELMKFIAKFGLGMSQGPFPCDECRAWWIAKEKLSEARRWLRTHRDSPSAKRRFARAANELRRSPSEEEREWLRTARTEMQQVRKWLKGPREA